jgi:integrase
MALELLVEVGTDTNGYYFTSGRTGQPYQPRSIDHACRDLFLPRQRTKNKTAPKPPLAGMEPIVPHDLRRTAATQMRVIGISREDVKLVLGHTETDVLGRHYDLHDGLAEKRRALQLWTGYLANLLAQKAGNVVDLQQARA